MKGSALRGALAAGPKGGGQRFQRPSMSISQPQQQQMFRTNDPAMGGVAQNIGASFGAKPYQFPQQQNMNYANGFSNSSDMNEQYDPNLTAITQSSMAAQQQFNQMPQEMQPGYLPAAPRQQRQFQNPMYRFQQGQPQPQPQQQPQQQMQQQPQQQRQQPQTISGMLQRNR
jgi:hypothetical protein